MTRMRILGMSVEKLEVVGPVWQLAVGRLLAQDLFKHMMLIPEMFLFSEGIEGFEVTR